MFRLHYGPGTNLNVSKVVLKCSVCVLDTEVQNHGFLSHCLEIKLNIKVILHGDIHIQGEHGGCGGERHWDVDHLLAREKGLCGAAAIVGHRTGTLGHLIQHGNFVDVHVLQATNKVLCHLQTLNKKV